MDDKLELLLTDGVIDEVHGRLKSGKEADIWIVRHGEEIVAAKIYKERQARNFRNNAAYREGRVVGNSRTQRAIERGSRFGQAAAEEAWKSAEADALYKLHAHGVRTPTPVMFYEGVLLMQLVTDEGGNPAPRLIDAPVTAETAGAIYRDLRAQVVRMLDVDVIHGDLSPYNVLMGAAGPTIIDFPQIITAAANNRAESFFVRDLENLRKHLAQYDRSLHTCAGDAQEIWRAYVRRELTPDFVPSERAPDVRQPHGPRGQPHAHARRERQEAGARDSRRGPQQDGRGGRPPQDAGRGRPQQDGGRGRPQQDGGRGRPQQEAARDRPQHGGGHGRPSEHASTSPAAPQGGRAERPLGKQGARAGAQKPQGRPGPVVERVNRPGPIVERVVRPGPVVERVVRPLTGSGSGPAAPHPRPDTPRQQPNGMRRHDRGRPPHR